MQSSFHFMHFKQYAQYLLNECLQDLARKYLQLLHEAKVPLLQALSTLPEEQQLQQVTKSFQEFLQQVLDNRALEGALQSTDQWHQNKAEIYRIENIQSHDLLLVFSARRKLYIHFLGRYTSDLAIGVKIMEEFEDFTVLVHQQALKAYEQIQQEELTKERNLLESVINNSIDGILAYDSELKIFVFNKVLEQHNGISKADVLGKKLFDIWPSYQDSEEGKAYFKVLAGEHVFLKNVPFRLKKGFYDLNLIPLYNPSGQIRGGISIVHDISERKNHEDALSEKNKVLQEQKDEQLALIEEQRANNEELEKIRKQLQQLNLELEGRVQERTAELEYQRQWLYSLFMQVPGLIGILSGEEGTVVLFNKAFTDLWGGRQVHGLPVRQAWPELEGQGYFETFQEVMRTGKAVQRLEHPSLVDRNNDGSLHQAYFNFMYAPYLNPKGETEGVILYGVDVTEQVESRKKVEQSEEKLKLALESGQMGIWEYDPVSNISYHSPLYNKLFGYDAPPSNWNYQIFMEHVLPEFKDQVAREYQNSLQTGTLIQESKILAADGIYKWIYLKGKVFFNDRGQPVRLVGIALDITDRKNAEEALQRSHQELKRINTDLDNFIYTASHDLRSPIVNLEGLISLLRNSMTDVQHQTQKQFLEMMFTSIGRLKQTIDALTDVTRIHKEDQVRETLSFERILEDVKLDLADQLAECNTVLTQELQEKKVQFAPHNLQSILFNLLSNAIKYRSPDRDCKIYVSTYRKGKYVVLEVRDNGMGISEANQQKLFSMFKRFHTHVKGSGIGLFLIKRIIENTGGRIEAESREGTGTTFRVFFPAS